MLHFQGDKSEATVSLAGKRGLGTGRGRKRDGKERRGARPVAGGRAFTEGRREGVYAYYGETLEGAVSACTPGIRVRAPRVRCLVSVQTELHAHIQHTPRILRT